MISLYIGDRLADTSEQNLVLLNLRLTDLTNPGIVKNSYSQDVTLPRTARNNQIFSESFRVDRVAGVGGVGVDFNASKKTAFVIYNDSGEILVSGYCKLVSVSEEGYKVSLFGGLGEFLYNLSYDTGGNKKTLASLDYGESLDFTINAQAVTDAWARMWGDTSKDAKWEIINFAPAYNGIPGDFQANKALVDASTMGLVSQDGNYGPSANGKTLLTLPNEVDEWGAKDLRSYLQRPVLNVGKLMDAIADPNNNGGWSVDLSGFNNLSYYNATWLTRPLIPSLGSYNQNTGGITAAFSSALSATSELATITLSNVPSGANVTIKGTFQLGVRFSPIPSVPSMVNLWLNSNNDILNGIYFAQAVAYASDNTIIGVSKVFATKNNVYYAGGIEQIASNCGYSPVTIPGQATEYDLHEGQIWFTPDGSEYVASSGVKDIELSVSAVNPAYVKIFVTRYTIDGVSGAKKRNGITLWYNGEYQESTCLLKGSATATSEGGALRSGALVTKEMLLTTEKTPADYLLAICKTFGLYILANSAEKSVQILKRNDLYQNETIDLTDKVVGEPEIVPLPFDAKWYEMKNESVKGRFEEEYKKTEGIQYGIQRIDTGYDFDAQTKQVFDTCLKSAAPVCDKGPLWCYVDDNGVFKPGLFLYGGITQTLWYNGESKEIDVPTPSSASVVTYYNQTYTGFDLAESRAEFRGKDGKAIDGADVLLFQNFGISMPHFAVTDDLAEMDAIAGGPCWIIGAGNSVTIPWFTRYSSQGQGVDMMLDFGYPRQTSFPRSDFKLASTIYENQWKNYLNDRLDVNNKVMKCKVLFKGMKVDLQLFRKFYWFRGGLWVLNSISNYSLTTFDPAECEFVQVKDMNNYTNGQA